MEFILLLVGEGHGCDYTIGCNRTWKNITADTVEDARKKTEEIIKDDYGDESIGTATLIQIASREKIDIKALEQAWKKEAAEQAAKKELKDKEALFQKLKQELGK